jgi:serine phosphatase RsbU (regulator of sigma subunit)
MPIGIFAFEKEFSSISFDLQKEDIIYMFRDGFIDQFGGDKNTKFMSKNFKKLLCKISDNQMNKQDKILKKEFENWHQNFEQIDDVLVMGLKI